MVSATALADAAAPGRNISVEADVSAGQSSTLSLHGLSPGTNVFDASAFAGGCSSVTAASIAIWVSDPVQAAVVASSMVGLKLEMHQNTGATVTVDFPYEGTGFCIVRDDFTNLPAVNAPDVGPGYAKVEMPGVDTFADLGAACTSAVYAALVQEACASGSRGPFQRELALTGPDAATGCAQIGCDSIACP